jgi:thioredoxin
MPVTNLTSKTFDQAVKENEMVIIDFWAPWCAPCKTFAPVFEAASETYTGVYFAKVNSEEEQELAESFGIRSIPDSSCYPRANYPLLEAGRCSSILSRRPS